VSTILCHYCDKTCFKEYNETIFSQWLINVLGPVIMGVKASEIMSFHPCDRHTDHKLKTIQELMLHSEGMKTMSFQLSDHSTKIVFYSHAKLNELLRDCRVIRFLQGEGYPTQVSIEGYLKHLQQRFYDVGMPHEIGVFLGYPIKDVMGFMGKGNLKRVKIQGWQVFGDERPSDYLYEAFCQARIAMRHRLENEGVLAILRSA
jgi:hypothetical protein